MTVQLESSLNFSMALHRSFSDVCPSIRTSLKPSSSRSFCTRLSILVQQLKTTLLGILIRFYRLTNILVFGRTSFGFRPHVAAAPCEDFESTLPLWPNGPEVLLLMAEVQVANASGFDKNGSHPSQASYHQPHPWSASRPNKSDARRARCQHR